MALFLDEQTLKDLGFIIQHSDYNQDNDLVLLKGKMYSEEYNVYFEYYYSKHSNSWFSLYHDGRIIVPDIETMDQFLKLASAFKF